MLNARLKPDKEIYRLGTNSWNFRVTKTIGQRCLESDLRNGREAVLLRKENEILISCVSQVPANSKGLASDMVQAFKDYPGTLIEAICQNKLCSYMTYLMNGTEVCDAALIPEQDKKRHIMHETVNRISHKLLNRGVKAAVIKGLSFEKCIYGQGNLRDPGDIDLLVSSGSTKYVHEALISMGYRQRIGPSSIGKTQNRALAAICASDAQNIDVSSHSPVRRHPYKSEFASYVLQGLPTIELHDGFFGLPAEYVDKLVEEASEDCLLLDPTKNFILFIMNSYENSESFYSNAFDHGIVLRDYVDLHHFISRYGRLLNWDEVIHLVNELDISSKMNIIMNNFEKIYGYSIDYTVVNKNMKLSSKWRVDIIERLCDTSRAEQAARSNFTRELHAISQKFPLAVSSDAEFLNCDYGISFESVTKSALQIKRRRDSFTISWVAHRSLLSEQNLFQVSFFPLSNENKYLSFKVDLGVYDGKLRAYGRRSKRFLSGAAIKKKAGSELPIEIMYKQDTLTISIEFDFSCMGIARYSSDSDIAMTADIFKLNIGNIYWSDYANRLSVVEGVELGRVGLLRQKGRCLSLIVGGISYVIGTDDPELAAQFRSVFPHAIEGWLFNKEKNVKNELFQVNVSDAGEYEVFFNGQSVEKGLSRSEAAHLVMQDMSDKIALAISGSVHVMHAAAVRFGSQVVVFMGTSGSGKTSIAIASSEYGTLMGDECVFIDTETGLAWCEDFPFQIKAENNDIMYSLGHSQRLEVKSILKGTAFYYPRTAVGADENPSKQGSVRYVVFPQYDKKVHEPSISPLDPSLLVKGILESVKGDESPSQTFEEFTRMIALCEIKILTIKYSNAGKAASLLQSYIKGREVQWNTD